MTRYFKKCKQCTGTKEDRKKKLANEEKKPISALETDRVTKGVEKSARKAEKGNP